MVFFIFEEESKEEKENGEEMRNTRECEEGGMRGICLKEREREGEGEEHVIEGKRGVEEGNVLIIAVFWLVFFFQFIVLMIFLSYY